jgi:ATPase subunit of ABC transporter with duplicated ATPase domains
MEGGAAKAASGGLGVAVGAGVDEYTRQRALQDQRNARAEDVAWRQARAAEEDNRWAATDARSAAMHGIQMDQLNRQQKQQKARDALMDAARQLDAFGGEIAKLDPNAPVPMELIERASKFYNEHPTMQNGMQASIQQIDGRPMMVHGVPGRSDAQILPITKDTLMAGSKEAGNLLIRNLA